MHTSRRLIKEYQVISYHPLQFISAEASDLGLVASRTDCEPNSSLICLVSVLLAIPVGIVLTLGVMLSFDIGILWAVPLYALLGSLAMAIFILIGHLRARTSG